MANSLIIINIIRAKYTNIKLIIIMLNNKQ